MEKADDRKPLNRRVAFEDCDTIHDNAIWLAVVHANHRDPKPPLGQGFREQGLLDLSAAS